MYVCAYGLCMHVSAQYEKTRTLQVHANLNSLTAPLNIPGHSRPKKTSLAPTAKWPPRSHQGRRLFRFLGLSGLKAAKKHREGLQEVACRGFLGMSRLWPVSIAGDASCFGIAVAALHITA